MYHYIYAHYIGKKWFVAYLAVQEFYRFPCIWHFTAWKYPCVHNGIQKGSSFPYTFYINNFKQIVVGMIGKFAGDTTIGGIMDNTEGYLRLQEDLI